MRYRRLLPSLVGVLMMARTGAAWAQASPVPPAPAASVDSLVRAALAASPGVRAATARVEAARAALGQAAALPDPVLMAGVMNAPAAAPAGTDMMTMRTVGVSQTLPFPGRLALRRRAAEQELASAGAGLDAARLEVAREVEDAYYELAYVDRALEVVRRNERVLADFARITTVRYGAGTAAQADVLTARIETSRLAEEAVALAEERRWQLARLNAALGRPSDTPLAAAAVPERLARAAVAADPRAIGFTSAALGARAAGSPLPPLDELRERAVRQSPALRAEDARIAAQTSRVETARRAHLPDFDLSLQYGQRPGERDVVSATVSVSLPVHRGSRQDLGVEEAGARLAELEAERQGQANELRARVTRAYAEAERERAQLAFLVGSILPQGRAALESATAGYQVGKVDFLALLESRAKLYDYETAYYRALSSFAQRVAELESLVGEEIIG
ncbi:MAG TPA: TolC family protein [Longimicrobiaceae bacterium]|nr:TolC family protein [Longimicrobiaceae bacterium]